MKKQSLKQKTIKHLQSMMNNTNLPGMLILFLLAFTSCKKDITTQPENRGLPSPQGHAVLATTTDCTPLGETSLFDDNTENLNVRLWENGYITYRIASDFSASEKATIKLAIKEWEDKTGVLVFRDVDDAAKRSDVVTVEDADASALASYSLSQWSRIEQNPLTPMLTFNRHDTKCYAGSIGKPSLLPAQIFASPNCDLISYIHEIGHVIGLIHEHQRSNRDNYLYFPRETYAYIQTSYSSVRGSVIGNLKKEITSYTDPYDFDPTSVMIYGSYPRNAIELRDSLMSLELPLYQKKSDCSLLERPTGISEKDIKLVRHLYPRKMVIDNRSGIDLGLSFVGFDVTTNHSGTLNANTTTELSFNQLGTTFYHQGVAVRLFNVTRPGWFSNYEYQTDLTDHFSDHITALSPASADPITVIDYLSKASTAKVSATVFYKELNSDGFVFYYYLDGNSVHMLVLRGPTMHGGDL